MIGIQWQFTDWEETQNSSEWHTTTLPTDDERTLTSSNQNSDGYLLSLQSLPQITW